MFIVELRSEVHGNEPFRHDTLEEALAGGKRLLRACKAEYRKDGIEREIVLVLGRIGGGGRDGLLKGDQQEMPAFAAK